MSPKVGERYRLARLAAGDPNAAFETNELDVADLAEGGDGIVYAASEKEAEETRAKVRQPPYGEMCRDPNLCRDKGYCPRDPTCGD